MIERMMHFKNMSCGFMSTTNRFGGVAWKDCFVHYRSVFSQCKGVPIGGLASAQYASVVLMYLERGVQWSDFPPCMRYRDNYLFLLDASLPSVSSDPGAYVADVCQRQWGCCCRLRGWVSRWKPPWKRPCVSQTVYQTWA